MKKIWDAWKAVAKAIGDFQFKLLFSASYFLIVSPLGLVVSLFKDFLSKKNPPKWIKVQDNVSTIERIRRQ